MFLFFYFYVYVIKVKYTSNLIFMSIMQVYKLKAYHTKVFIC